MEPTILIVDDEKHTRDGLRMSLEDEFEIYLAADRLSALEVLKADRIDVMVTDLRLGGDDGMELIDEVLALPSPPICIMMTAFGSVDTAVEAMKRGAYDFVAKPLNLDELEILIKRALRTRSVEHENRELKKQVERKFSSEGIIGQSDVIREVISIIEQVAPSRATVLIEGESGTGKELVARALHALSGRPNSKLVTVHCAALSPQILESELFGHEKGAFTGATAQRIGRFEMADGGTLFLDEIGEIDPSTQVKLLRALGEQTIERVGGNATIEVDVRVVAATNKNLAELVEKGEFREDLYYRLHVVRLEMPPLRKRKDDIPLLAGHFLEELAGESGTATRELSPEALQILTDHSWPGNVRELRTAVEHGVVMSQGQRITPRHLPLDLTGRFPTRVRANSFPSTGHSPAPPDREAPQSFNLEEMERRLIGDALKATDGNRTEAAKLLGISRRTLHRKLARESDSRPS